MNILSLIYRNKCKKSTTRLHKFQIVKNSKYINPPLWECFFCKKQVRST